jgi:CspA family cold shock protein
MITGTVKFFNADKGYGFISPENGGDDNFVHISAVERAGMSTLNKDQRVKYELETDRRGKTSAVKLRKRQGPGSAARLLPALRGAPARRSFQPSGRKTPAQGCCLPVHTTQSRQHNGRSTAPGL